MKKFLFVLLIVLVGFGALVTVNGARSAEAPVTLPAEEIQGTAAPAEAETPAAEEPAPSGTPAEPEPIRELDYAAIRALRGEDEKIMTLGDESASWKQFCDQLQSTGMHIQTADWGTFFDLLRSTGVDIEEYFEQMAAYYGVAADWEGSVGDGSGQTYAQYAVSEAKNYLESILTVRGFAASHGIRLGDEALAALEPQAMADAVLGEGASLDEFYAKLDSEAHMSFETYRAMREASLLYSAVYEELYGTAGEKLSEEDAVAWLQEQGYLAAGHILLMTIDPNTGSALEESEISAKREKAGEIAAELQAIQDQEELLKRFLELKEEHCEDTGKTVYPDGYTFQPGTMVQEFESAVQSLEEYAVSDPVETAYGYHVIMRLPLKGDASLLTLQGTSTTARQELAQKRITEDLDAFQEAHPVEFAEGVENFDLVPFLK